jgi:hypothetical protein
MFIQLAANVCRLAAVAHLEFSECSQAERLNFLEQAARSHRAMAANRC